MPPTATLSSKLLKALRHPLEAWAFAASYVRGYVVRLSCRVRGVRFEAGRNLRVRGKLVLRGPGRVVFGDNIIVERVVTPWTYSPDAVIEVGSNSYLNGARFGAQQRISIGARAILADVSILDTDFHSLHVDRHDPAAPVRVQPVVIGENVWLASGVGVLPGTTIGRNSVVGFGAVCAGSYPADSIIVGNPARVVKAVPGTASAAPLRAEDVPALPAHPGAPAEPR
jgi:acetyltransferase-like isoleucine patch superfamily enzyme